MITKSAVRTFNHLWTDIAANISESESCDRQFDYGEFSGEAYGRIWEEEYEALIGRVAQRYGITNEKLSAAIIVDEEEYENRVHAFFWATDVNYRAHINGVEI